MFDGFWEFWDKYFNPLRYFLIFLQVIFLANWCHEFNHLWTYRRFGGDGYVTYYGFAFYMVPTVVPSWAGQVVTAFAGGILSALAGWFYHNTIRPSSIEQRCAIYAISLSQLFYGLVEGVLYATGNFDVIVPVGTAFMMFGALIGVATSKAMYRAEEFYTKLDIAWDAVKWTRK